jgi:hypothetical protein
MDIKKIEDAHKLAETMSILLNFTPRGRFDRGDTLFSKKYMLTKILGFTDEEYKEMQDGLIEELAELKLRQKRIDAELKKLDLSADFEEDYKVKVETRDCNESW